VMGDLYTDESLRASASRCGIPEHMHDGIVHYILYGLRPGSFLFALVSGDFWEMARRADAENFAAFQSYAKFFYNDTPGGCFGSIEKVVDWMNHKGMEFKEVVTP
jgi:hypothetical protein